MTYLIKAFKVFDRGEKYKVFAVLVFSVCAAILEMIGITLALPVMTILLEGNLNSNYFQNFIIDFDFIERINKEDLLFASLYLLIFGFLIKNFFLFIFNFYNFKVVNNISARISKTIFDKYLSQNFDFHLKNNSTKLINNCVTVVDGYKDTLTAIIILFSELIVLTGIVLLLAIIEPKGFFLSLFFVLLLGLAVYYASRGVLVKWGQKVIKAQENRFLFLTQALGAIREIKIFDKKDFFLKKYFFPNQEKYRISTLQSTVNNLPKYLMEFIFILTLSFLLIFLKNDGSTNNEIIIIMGIFALASIRIMPSLNRILSAFQIFKFGQQPIDDIYKELKDYKIKKNSTSLLVKNKSNENLESFLVSLENVFFKYLSSKKYILNDINFDIKQKEFVGIIGETGSGKSTLINMILGLLNPNKGIIKKNYLKAGFVPQSPYLIDDTIKNNIALGIDSEKIDMSFMQKCISDVQLSEFIKTQPNGINSLVGEKGIRISGGELQRLALARALYVKPDTIILDEPTSSLDKNTEKKILGILKSLSKKLTIIIVTHNLDNLEYCDKVIHLKNNQAFLNDKIK